MSNRLFCACLFWFVVNSSLVFFAITHDQQQEIIKPQQVTRWNYERYIAQFEDEFPPGTPVLNVKEYLLEHEVPYGYISPRRLCEMLQWGGGAPEAKKYVTPDRDTQPCTVGGAPPDIGSIKFMLRDIYFEAFIFASASLQVRIYFSENAGILGIASQIYYSGF